MLRRIDVYLIDRVCQKISNKWHLLTGKNCFWIAKLFNSLRFLLAVVFCLMDPAKGTLGISNIHPIYFIPISVIGLAVFCDSIGIKEYEKRCHKNEMFRNENYNSRYICRVFGLMILVISAVGCFILSASTKTFALGAFLFSLSWCLLEYFASCTPLPPAKSKIRQWADAAKGFLVEILSPAPEPIPVPVPASRK
jgi:hypothetical protein